MIVYSFARIGKEVISPHPAPCLALSSTQKIESAVLRECSDRRQAKIYLCKRSETVAACDKARFCRKSEGLSRAERVAGIEPATAPWKGAV